MQILSLLSFFQTKMMAEAQGLEDVCIAPVSNISWTCAWTPWYMPSGIFLYNSLSSLESGYSFYLVFYQWCSP